jgi:ArsR family transcriptional regulator, arsenate/arsenite/antimonite-responsive transcriptional repressor
MKKTRTTIERLEDAFKALADRTRLRILALLGNNEVCVCHLHDSLGVPQPTVSRHLAYLRRTGLVSARRDGVWMHYRVSPSLPPEIRQVLDAAVQALTSVTTTARDRAQFEKAFGPLYVVPTDAGGACCAPRGE